MSSANMSSVSGNADCGCLSPICLHNKKDRAANIIQTLMVASITQSILYTVHPVSL